MLDAAEESASLDVAMDTKECGTYISYDDGYRVRNLWIDVCMHAMQKGWASKTAADAADECVDRYKAKLDVK